VSVDAHADLAARVEASFAAEDWDVDAASVEDAIGLLDRGEVRVAEPTDEGWVVNEWAKKAVLLYFRVRGMETIESGPFEYHDKLPLKHGFVDAGVRVVPPAAVRYGAFLSPGVILMPSYVNIGAWVGPGTMVDTWATVGSCAQIGKNVHLSGGVGIGGVLEPVQANPTIIEDNCFIGARSEVVEGVIVGTGAVLSMGVFISANTRIVDRETGQIHIGKVPPYSVVHPGTMGGGPDKPARYCVIITKIVDERTRSKTSINELLRD
jgi:2,3,4,5-tetrahydropyridine-2-carboxylate N-succinyltransferase